MQEKKIFVIWLTGLPCSGKTTLSKKVEEYFRENDLSIQRLDGDVVRETVSRDLGFSKRDRDRNIERISYIAQMLSHNGVHVVSAFVSPYQEMRDFARSLCMHSHFMEVHIDCSIEKCKERDVKGMYAMAERGKIADFTGVQDPFEIPQCPEVVVNTEKESVGESLQKIITYIESRL